MADRTPHRRAVGVLASAILATAGLAALPGGLASQSRDRADAAADVAEASAGPEPPALPLEVDDLVTVVDHPEERELEVVIGPVSLPAKAHLRTPVQMATLPIEGWLHGYAWSVTDAEGRPLPDRFLHHVNLLDPDKRELFAPIPRRVLSAGRETGSQEMPGLLGYPIHAGTRVLISPMFENPTETDHEAAYLRLRLSYTGSGDGLLRPRDVYPFYLDVMGPVGPKHFAVPPGRSVVAWEGRPAIDGRILAIGGHLHDFGTRLRLIDLTEEEVVYEVEPETDERGRVVRVPTAKLWWKGGIRIRKEHTYRIEVVYDNPLDRPAPDGGMGVLGGVVLASGSAEWPPLDRNDVAYVEDLRNTLEEPFRDPGHGMHGMTGGRMEDHGAGASGESAERGGAGAGGEPAAHDHGG